ncbi:MAG: DegV family protein [Chloroflexi bacterium]|nr:DegV family protein [Chloroflexota bacterium]
MVKTALVTDSSAYLPPALMQKHRVQVIPLYIHFGAESLRDGVELTTAEFYDRLARADTLPTTSQPSVGDFLELYRRLGQDAEAIVSIHISSGLSGTVPSALGARQVLSAEAAEAGVDPPTIHVVDSTLTSAGLGLLVTAAARAIEAGQPAQAVVRTVEELIPRMRVIFVVDTLEYLQKGGRIGGAAALLGSMLQVKPILHLTGGRIDVLEKVRTARKAKQRLLGIMEEQVGQAGAVHAAVIHANAPPEAEMLRQQVADRFQCRELFVCELSPAIATHVGPGAVGVAFYAEAQATV